MSTGCTSKAGTIGMTGGWFERICGRSTPVRRPHHCPEASTAMRPPQTAPAVLCCDCPLTVAAVLVDCAPPLTVDRCRRCAEETASLSGLGAALQGRPLQGESLLQLQANCVRLLALQEMPFHERAGGGIQPWGR